MSDQKYVSFTDAEVKEVLIKWWQELDQARGDRAALRRCRTPYEVALNPAYHRLCWELKKITNIHDEALASVAGVVSHVRTNTETKALAAQMADGDKCPVSELRFRRLLQIQNRLDLYPALVRIVHLLNNNANLASLAD